MKYNERVANVGARLRNVHEVVIGKSERIQFEYQSAHGRIIL
jgi:hypothetical protein